MVLNSVYITVTQNSNEVTIYTQAKKKKTTTNSEDSLKQSEFMLR